MLFPSFNMRVALNLLLLFLAIPFSSALKFDLQAFPGHNPKNERCIRNFVSKDTLVVVTATVSGQRGDGQMVNMHVRLPSLSKGSILHSIPLHPHIRQQGTTADIDLLHNITDQRCSWQ